MPGTISHHQTMQGNSTMMNKGLNGNWRSPTGNVQLLVPGGKEKGILYKSPKYTGTIIAGEKEGCFKTIGKREI